MPYDDELGLVLDKLSRRDLRSLSVDYLRCNEKSVKGLSKPNLRKFCSENLRSAGGHSFVNIFRGKHDLPYRDIVLDVAKFLKVSFSENDEVYIVEHRILAKAISEAWEKMTSEQKEEVLGKINKEILKSNITLNELSLSTLTALIKSGFASTSILGTASVGVFTAGSFATAVGGIAGLTVIQTVVFQAILSYVGYVAAAEALLGIGIWGGVLAAAGWAGPVGAALGGAYVAHKVADVAYRKTIPSVLFLAQKRKELFNIEIPDSVL